MKAYTNEQFKAVTEMDIHEMWISVRVANQFNNMAICTIGQLLTWSEYDLKRYKWRGIYNEHRDGHALHNWSGLGLVSLKEIKDKLALLSLELRPVKNPHVKPAHRYLAFSNINCIGDNKPHWRDVWEIHRMNRLIACSERKIEKQAEVKTLHFACMANMESELQRSW